MKQALLAALAFLSVSAFAHGSSHPKAGDQSPAQMIPIETAQRVLSWPSNRHWQTTMGEILVCPWDAVTGYSDMTCKDKKSDANRWMILQDYKIPGYELAGFSYSYAGSGGSLQLITYFRQPKAAAPQEPQAQPTATITVQQLTVKTDKLVIERPRKK